MRNTFWQLVGPLGLKCSIYLCLDKRFRETQSIRLFPSYFIFTWWSHVLCMCQISYTSEWIQRIGHYHQTRYKHQLTMIWIVKNIFHSHLMTLSFDEIKYKIIIFLLLLDDPMWTLFSLGRSRMSTLKGSVLWFWTKISNDISLNFLLYEYVIFLFKTKYKALFLLINGVSSDLFVVCEVSH